MGRRHPSPAKRFGGALNDYNAEYRCAETAFVTLSSLLAEARPSDASLTWLKKRGPGPDDAALLLFEAAVEYVHLQHAGWQLDGWQHRQERMHAWLRWLDEPTDAAGLEASVMRTGYREVLADDLFELVEQRSRRRDEAERMHTIVASARQRVARILTRYAERRAELRELDSVTEMHSVAADRPDSPQQYEQAGRFVRLTEVASAQIDAQTLRALATHGRTAGMGLGEFREVAAVFTDLLPA